MGKVLKIKSLELEGAFFAQLISQGISDFKVSIYESTLCLKQIAASLIQINEVIYVQ